MGGDELLPYEVIRRLGQGGTGEVLLAHSPEGELALKLLRKDLAAPLAEQILATARKLKTIRHPALARVVSVGTCTNGRPFIANEYIAGSTLGDLLAMEGAIDYPRGVALAVQICDGLAAAAKAGIVHGDVKPSNIMLTTGQENIKLLDFQGAQPGGTAAPLGNPEYWSPEQACGQATDGRSDIYSLGIVLYELLTGATPFRSHSYSDLVQLQLHAEPTRLVPPAKVRPIPAAVQDVVLRCLRKDPTQRFTTAAELCHALQRAGTATEKPAGRPASRRMVPLLTAGGAAVLLAVAASVVAFSRKATQRNDSAVVVADDIAIAVDSKPTGAFVYRAAGGHLLGTTPGTFHLARGEEAVNLLVRFPDGTRTQLRVVPDKPARLYVQSPRNAAAE